MQLHFEVLQNIIMHTEVSTTDRLLPDDQSTRRSQLGNTAEWLNGCCSRKEDKCGHGTNKNGSPVVAEVCVGKRLHRSVSEEAPPRDSLFSRGSQLDSWPTMLLVALELCGHLRLLDGDPALDLLKPYCPSQACATQALDVIVAYLLFAIAKTLVSLSTTLWQKKPLILKHLVVER